MTLLEPYNLPFAIALAALFAVGLMQLVGAGDFFDGAGDVEIDMDADVTVTHKATIQGKSRSQTIRFSEVAANRRRRRSDAFRRASDGIAAAT